MPILLERKLWQRNFSGLQKSTHHSPWICPHGNAIETLSEKQHRTIAELTDHIALLHGEDPSVRLFDND
jgi:hypothetical protein